MQLTVERCNITHVSVTIPPKILSNIFRQLRSASACRFTSCQSFPCCRASDSTEDIKKLRLVCKAFSYAAAPFLIQTVFLSSSQQDLDVLKAVSAHAVFSKYVTDLVYDCRMFDEALTTDKAAYMEELRPQSLSAFNEGILITKRAAKESFQAYGRLFRQQKDCREGQLDMACLHEAFTKMPHLAHISIRGKPRPRLLPEYENVVHHPDRRFADLNVVLPRPRMSWRRDRQVNVHNEVCHHGVLDFLTTISSPNISKQLQSLSMGYPTDNEELRLCPELFDGSVVCVNSIGHLCKTLRKIQLTVRIGDDQDEAWPLFLGQLPISNDHLECQKRLCWALMFATGLECLHLTFNCARRQRGNEVQLNNILGGLKYLTQCYH